MLDEMVYFIDCGLKEDNFDLLLPLLLWPFYLSSPFLAAPLCCIPVTPVSLSLSMVSTTHACILCFLK